MKILFIQPYDTAYRYRTAFLPSLSYMPLTLPVLAALVPFAADITLVDEGVRHFDYSRGHYDIVCISIVTSTAPRGYALADFFRARGSYVLIGGHHATLLPDEAALHADMVFTGSAERTFPAFFADYAAGQPLFRYDSPGVRAEEVPVPRRDLMPKKGYLRQPTVMADFGCSNHCAYCAIPGFWGSCAKRPVSAVLDEIRALGAKEILLLDPSPFSDEAYSHELLEGFSSLKIKWAGLAALDIAAKANMLSLLERSGCVGLLMGFESFSQQDLLSMGKYKNKVDTYAQAVERMHAHGIAVLGTFMLGLDSDSEQSLSLLPQLIEDIKIDVPRFAILTPWPGTPLFRRLDEEGRIFSRDWGRYDSFHCVFTPKQMSAPALEQKHLQIWRECYTGSRIAKRLSHTPRRKITSLVTNIGFRIYGRRLKGLI